jgi:hypothetical protein
MGTSYRKNSRQGTLISEGCLLAEALLANMSLLNPELVERGWNLESSTIEN